MSNVKEIIESGKAVLGIELGSTRIKAVLIDDNHAPIASGDHEWENQLENGFWTYALDDIWAGLKNAYANLAKNVTGEEVEKIYKDFYKGEYFIRIMSNGKIPESNWVAGSNFANIGFQIDERLGRIVVCSTIDNLIKGAAGQAVQNMNIMMGFEENAGLDMPAMYL